MPTTRHPCLLAGGALVVVERSGKARDAWQERHFLGPRPRTSGARTGLRKPARHPSAAPYVHHPHHASPLSRMGLREPLGRVPKALLARRFAPFPSASSARHPGGGLKRVIRLIGPASEGLTPRENVMKCFGAV